MGMVGVGWLILEVLSNFNDSMTSYEEERHHSSCLARTAEHHQPTAIQTKTAVKKPELKITYSCLSSALTVHQLLNGKCGNS